MADLASLVTTMSAQGAFRRIATNPAAQFGPRARPYLGATLMPERLVPENSYREEAVRYRTVIANAGTRYSPTQKKGGALVGSFLVELAESDIASELTSRDYDALLAVIGRNATLDAMAQLTRFVDTTVNLPLVEWIERARWQAIVDASVLLRGDNEYTETVAYSNPAGHRAAAAAAWSTDTVDPYDDIFNRVELLASKGFTVDRIITSRRVIGILGGNAKAQSRTGQVRVNAANGAFSTFGGRASLDQLNGQNQADGLPPFELYDAQYRTMTGTGRFLADNVMVFVGTSGRDESVDLGDTTSELIRNTIGYAAVGRAAGQATAGRVIRSEAFQNKPPRVEAEGWQTALPVILEPEAIATISGIA